MTGHLASAVAPIDLVLQRLDGYKLRDWSPGRWRCCCPAHGGSNPSALSVGIGDEGRVLLKCWHGCGAAEVAAAIGLELSDLFPSSPWWPGDGAPPKKHRHLLSAGQALQQLDTERQVVWVAAHNLKSGHKLTDADLQRLNTACVRIQSLADEVRA